MDIVFSSDQQCALNCALAGFDMCIFGEGGTGKSFVLMEIITQLKAQGKNVLVCAPTGIAAADINGATIHRAFNFPSTVAINSATNTIKVHASDIVCIADVIVIDEISMVRMDFFDSVIASIRAAEKAGENPKRKQIILCGDPFQTAPFVAREDEWDVLIKYYGRKINPPWFFMGKEWEQSDFKIIELKEIYRQQDPEFKSQLSLLRIGDTSCIGYFNSKCHNTPDPNAVFLLPSNKSVRDMNTRQLKAVPGPFYELTTIVTDNLLADSRSMMWVKKYSEPVRLKEGCRVMIIANDTNSENRSIDVVDYLTDVPPWKMRKNKYVNGSMGVVESIKIHPDRRRDDSVFVRLDDSPNELVEIFRYEYPVNQYVIRDDVLVLDRIGTFSMIPVVPAYAFTIHKAQGKTFKKVNVDPRCVGNGQLYVAVSRAVSVENLHLLYPIRPEYVKASPDVLSLMENLHNDKPLFMAGKRGPKPKPPVRTPGEPAKVKKKPGRKSSYGECGTTKAVRLPSDIADWLTYTLGMAFPKDKSANPDLTRYKKLMSLIEKMPEPQDK